MIHFAVEEYHPRWGARTSNPVKSVNNRLGGFDSCLFRHLLLKTIYFQKFKLLMAIFKNEFFNQRIYFFGMS